MRYVPGLGMFGFRPLLSLGLIVVCVRLAPAAEFRASVVKVDITPPTSKWLAGHPARQSTGVHDRIYHRIAAMGDGRTQFFLVSSDLCLFAPSVYDEATAQLKKETGIEPAQVWWTVTHKHSAPEVGPHGLLKLMMPERYNHEPDREYTAFVEKSLIEGIKKARAELVPARLAFGTGYSAANINRRARDVDGQISLGLNPDGPTDRQIGLIRIEHTDGSIIALIANYSMHGSALGPHNTLISGDAPGVVESYVEEKLGAPLLFINGAAGNLAPIYTVQEDFRAARITEFNVLAGDRILAAARSLTPASPEGSIREGERFVETPRRKGFGWDNFLVDYLQPDRGEAGTIRFPIRYASSTTASHSGRPGRVILRDFDERTKPLAVSRYVLLRLCERLARLSGHPAGFFRGWLRDPNESIHLSGLNRI